MLPHLHVVLVTPKFAENVGAAARACANMGCANLVLVAPQRWDEERARTLATGTGLDVLRTMRQEPDLATAVQGMATVFGTTARGGGWRKGILTPAQAAPLLHEVMQQGEPAALVFGPEDHGLTNEDTSRCSRLVTIPTASEHSSLNLAQAVLLMLYTLFTTRPAAPFRPAGPPESRLATHGERETLYATLQATLTRMDFLKGDNPDYWMLPIRRFLERTPLRRHEFNLLMGLCRQVAWLAGGGTREGNGKDAQGG